jgi:hypothetical protein
MQRVVIYPKDVMMVTGLCEKSSRKLLRQIKETLSKEKHHFVSVSEFCQFTGIPANDVERSLRS